MENKDPDVQTFVHKMHSPMYALTYIGLQNCDASMYDLRTNSFRILEKFCHL